MVIMFFFCTCITALNYSFINNTMFFGHVTVVISRLLGMYHDSIMGSLTKKYLVYGTMVLLFLDIYNGHSSFSTILCHVLNSKIYELKIRHKFKIYVFKMHTKFLSIWIKQF